MFRRRRSKFVFFLTVLSIIVSVLVKQRYIILPPTLDPFLAPDLRSPPWFMTNIQLKNLDIAPDICVGALKQAGLNSKLLTSEKSKSNCTRQDSVQMSKLSIANLKSEQTRCNITARLYMWERHSLQPLAIRYFGQSIKEITHFGSYSCRTIAGSNHMSQHATANAFDISGFVLRSGTMISLKKDWHTNDNQAAFLHEARNSLCNYFNTVLSPDYNKAHADHFHVDMGRYRTCR